MRQQQTASRFGWAEEYELAAFPAPRKTNRWFLPAVVACVVITAFWLAVLLFLQ